jgi:hypothetical protein
MILCQKGELKRLFNDLVENSLSEINYSENKIVLSFLKKISEGENLDYEYLKSKYLYNKKILEKYTDNNSSYYYENEENGKVYDYNSKIVGVIKNGNVTLY